MITMPGKEAAKKKKKSHYEEVSFSLITLVQSGYILAITWNLKVTQE